MAWYGLLLVCLLTVWQTAALLSSAFLIMMRNDHMKRFHVALNVARMFVTAALIVGAFLVLNISGHERSYVRCSGWNVWALVVVPRAIWLGMLIYDLAHLLHDRWRRSVFRVLGVVLAVLYTVACYIAMSFYGGQMHTDSVSGACYASVGVEWLHFGFTAALLALALLVVVTPWWEFHVELVQHRLLRISGVSLIPILADQTVREFEPVNFDELDRWMRATRVRMVRERRRQRALHNGANLVDVQLEGLTAVAFGGPNDDHQEEDETASVVADEDAILSADPSIGWQDRFMDLEVDYDAMQEFDRRTRAVCLYGVMLGGLLLPLLCHVNAGAWTFHIAWRVSSFLLCMVPLLYWQWYSALRPSLKRAIGLQLFLRGAECIQNAQVKLMRFYLNHYDFTRDLTEYVSSCKEAEYRDPERVSQFLRVPLDHSVMPLQRTKDRIVPMPRDRYLEFQLWLAVHRRKQLDDPIERDAAARAIYYQFFDTYSRMNPRLPQEAGTVALCTGFTNDHVELFDELLIALMPRLEQREDEHQIIANARRLHDEQQQQQQQSQEQEV